MAEKPILKQIADMYGITVKTATRRIREHPELGVVIEQRKAPVLDEKQIQGLCKILDEEYKRADLPNDTLRRTQGMSKRVLEIDADSPSLSIGSLSKIAELEAEIAQLRTDLAVSEARAEERKNQIEDLKRQTEQFPKLLEAGQEEIASLKEEVSQAREEVSAAREEWKTKGLFDRWFKR